MPPDNTRAAKPASVNARPNLLARAVIAAVEDVAKAKGLAGARVAYKRNTAGDHVVAVIWGERHAP